MKKKTKKYAEPRYAKIPLLILSFYFALSVILVFPAEVPVKGAAEYFISGNGIYVDCCIFSREIIMLVLSAGLILYFIGERIFPGTPLKAPLFANRSIRLPLIFLGVYVLWAVVSSIFSEYGYISWWGFPTELEGIAAVISYAVIFMAAYNRFFREKAGAALKLIVFGACSLIAVMTLVEIFYMPVTAALFGYADERAGSALLFGNSSNCGIVCTVLLPIAFSLCLEEKKTAKRIALFVLTGMLLLCIVRTNSSAALYASILALLTVIIFTLVRKITSPKQLLAAIALTISPLLIYSLLCFDQFSDYFKSELTNAGVYDPSGSFGLTDIEIKKNELELTGKTGKISLVLDNGNIEFCENGTPVEAIETEDGLTLLDERYSMITAKNENGLLILDMGYAEPIYFEITNDRYQYIGLNGYFGYITKPAFPQLSEYYRLGTGRVYIWLSTVPLLKDCLFKGFGAGQYPFYYPHNDVVGLLNTHGTAMILTSKPHCMYLQIFTSYGLPALIVFICFVFLVLKTGLKNVLREKSCISVGLLVGVAAFLLLGTVNDSSPAISGWFWLFSGIMLAFSEKGLAQTQG
ncbi:MAG: O-antigen ligase family protein [Oscillospiraceae bacterium]